MNSAMITLYIFINNSQRCLYRWEPVSSSVRCGHRVYDLASDGNLVYASLHDGTIEVWNVAEGRRGRRMDSKCGSPGIR